MSEKAVHKQLVFGVPPRCYRLLRFLSSSVQNRTVRVSVTLICRQLMQSTESKIF